MALVLEGMSVVVTLMVDEGSPTQIRRLWCVGGEVQVVLGGMLGHPVLQFQGGLRAGAAPMIGDATPWIGAGGQQGGLCRTAA